MIEQVAFGKARIALFQAGGFIGVDVGYGFSQFGLFLLGQYANIALVFAVLFGQQEDAAANGSAFQGHGSQVGNLFLGVLQQCFAFAVVCV